MGSLVERETDGQGVDGCHDIGFLANSDSFQPGFDGSNQDAEGAIFDRQMSVGVESPIARPL